LQLIKKFENYRNFNSLDTVEIKKLVANFNNEIMLEKKKIQNTNIHDMYGTVTIRELINRNLIELQINPNVREDVLFSVLRKYLK